mmetsp:Transcript_47214/g.137343  ORF Transcript_47214/g.137343 Transcript_47214/m.137343 type:complete len:420 (-) Transcript_47214:166-1425(-)
MAQAVGQGQGVGMVRSEQFLAAGQCSPCERYRFVCFVLRVQYVRQLVVQGHGSLGHPLPTVVLGEHAPVQGFGLLEFSLGVQQAGEHRGGRERLRVIRAQPPLSPAQDPPKQHFGLLELALGLQEVRHVVDTRDGVRILRPESHLTALQRSAGERFRLCHLALGLQQRSQVVHAFQGVRMGFAEPALLALHDSAIQRLRLGVVPARVQQVCEVGRGLQCLRMLDADFHLARPHDVSETPLRVVRGQLHDPLFIIAADHADAVQITLRGRRRKPLFAGRLETVANVHGASAGQKDGQAMCGKSRATRQRSDPVSHLRRLARCCEDAGAQQRIRLLEGRPQVEGQERRHGDVVESGLGGVVEQNIDVHVFGGGEHQGLRPHTDAGQLVKVDRHLHVGLGHPVSCAGDIHVDAVLVGGRQEV